MKYVTEKELRAAEKRNAFADRMAARIGVEKVSEFAKLVAEVRASRDFRTSLGLKPLPDPKAHQRKARGRGKRWDKMIERIKADAASGKMQTLITLSVRDMADTARRLTIAELRNVRFTFMGLSMQHLALDARAQRKKPKP